MISRITPALAAPLLAAFLSGCVSTGVFDEESIRTSEGLYKAPASASLPNDIQQILTAGGLNPTDPSAPVNGTRTAELKNDVAPPAEIEKLVAGLETSSRPTVPSASPAPTQQTADPELKALAMVTPAAAPQPIKIEPEEPAIETVTINYPDIGVTRAAQEPSANAVRRLPEAQQKVVNAAAKPAPRPKLEPAKQVNKPRRF